MPGSTPIYGLRYLELGDAPNIAKVGKDLGEDVEAELARIDAAEAASAAADDVRLDALEAITTRRGCRLRRASQSIANATTVAINWDTEDQDTNGYITATSTTITIPTGLGGLYAITFNSVIAAVAGRCFVEIVPTSTITGMPTEFRNYMDVDERRAEVAVTIPLNAADTFVCNVFHTNGSAQTATSWLSCYRVGA